MSEKIDLWVVTDQLDVQEFRSRRNGLSNMELAS